MSEHALVPFEPQSLDQAMTLARTLAVSALLPESLRKKPEDVLVVLMTGRELGLSPMQSVRGLHVIKGRPVISADLMVALAQRSPVCEFFRLVESTDTRASYETKRKGSDVVKMSFTIEQAKAAGLTGKDTWRSYPAAMLRARCAASLARAVYADLLFGVYEHDEADDLRKTDGSSRNGNGKAAPAVIDVTPVAPAEEPKAPEPTPAADVKPEPEAPHEDGPDGVNVSPVDELCIEGDSLGAGETDAFNDWIKKAMDLKRSGISNDDIARLNAKTNEIKGSVFVKQAASHA